MTKVNELNLPEGSWYIIVHNREKDTYSLVAPTASWESIKANDSDWKLTTILEDKSSMDEILNWIHDIDHLGENG